jgi:hypothetical protein
MSTRVAISPAPGYVPRPGWTVLSVYGADHLVDPQGNCVTCGEVHQ